MKYPSIVHFEATDDGVRVHAYIADLQRFVEALKPRNIIPIHTFFPEKYSECFGGNIMFVKDGDTVEI